MIYFNNLEHDPCLDIDHQFANRGLLNQGTENDTSNPILSAQQRIATLNSVENLDLHLLPDGMADSNISIGMLPPTPTVGSVHQIAESFFEEASREALLNASDMAAVAQSSATSSHLQAPLQAPSLAEDQQQNGSSSISPTPEKTEAKTEKASKRKQPEAPKSTKGKRKKTTSSRAAASSPATKSDPLPVVMIALHNNTEHYSIPQVITNLGLDRRYPRFDAVVRKYIYAIADRFLHEKPDGTISEKALKPIYAKYMISKARIEPLIPEARKNKQIYFDYFEKYKHTKKTRALNSVRS